MTWTFLFSFQSSADFLEADFPGRNISEFAKVKIIYISDFSIVVMSVDICIFSVLSCSAKIRQAFGERSASIRRAFGERSASVRRAFGERSASVRRAFGERSAKVQRAFGKSSASVQ
jgi:hypothetical protein